MTLDVGVVGFGEVGRALARALQGAPGLRVVALADRSGGLYDAGGIDLEAALRDKGKRGSLGGDAARGAPWIAGAAPIDVLVDLLPTDLRTGEPSLSLQTAALLRGVSVVTANKGVAALHAAKARLLVARSRAQYRCSGAVAGGTPVIELLGAAFRGDTVERFDAVLNGSTNFILEQLEHGTRWEDAVAEARRRGILEADPSLDLLGIDAAAKGTILANAAWGTGFKLADAEVRGIMGVSAREAQEARASGLAIRLVVRASREGGVAVAPVTLPRDHALVVDGKENAIRLKLARAGTITLRGPGAGGDETAGAVLNDLLAVARERPAQAVSIAV